MAVELQRISDRLEANGYVAGAAIIRASTNFLVRNGLIPHTIETPDPNPISEKIESAKEKALRLGVIVRSLSDSLENDHPLGMLPFKKYTTDNHFVYEGPAEWRKALSNLNKDDRGLINSSILAAHRMHKKEDLSIRMYPTVGSLREAPLRDIIKIRNIGPMKALILHIGFSNEIDENSISQISLDS
jgi:hypothetical protein